MYDLLAQYKWHILINWNHIHINISVVLLEYLIIWNKIEF